VTCVLKKRSIIKLAATAFIQHIQLAAEQLAVLCNHLASVELEGRNSELAMKTYQFPPFAVNMAEYK